MLKYPKVSFDSYKPQIVKSGIKKYNNTKEYLDTSSVEGINNIIESNTVTYNTRPSRANMQPMVNSIWFAKMKESNKVIIVTNHDEDLLSEYIFSTGFFGLQSNSSLPLSFLTAIVCSKSFKEQRDLNSVGTTMAGINNDTFMKILVPKLNKDELLRYDYIYSHYVNQLSLYRRKIISLKQAKQLLLDKYF